LDLDSAFVSALLAEGTEGWRTAIEKGIQAGDLSGNGRLAFDYTSEHLQTYGTLPALDVVEGRLGITLGAPQGKAVYFADEINNRKLHGAIQTGVTKIINTLRDDKPQTAYIEVENLLAQLRREQVVGTRVRPWADTVQDAWAFYERIKAGETGVLTPWASINEATLGFWPQDLIIVAARQGVGKSWFAIIVALHAWMNGKKVLFATTEMAQIAVSMRMLALYNRISYGDFRHGRLGMFVEKRVLKSIDDLKGAHGLWIIGGDFDFRTESLESAMEEVQPDFTVADGAYLMDTADGGNTRTEKAASAFNALKRIAKRRNSVIMATTQFNRSASSEKTSSIKLENIGLTDVVGWNADLAFGLIQTEDMRTDKKMTVKPLKVREGVGKEATLEWDMETMDFREIRPEDPEADEFSTGVTVPPSDAAHVADTGSLF